MINFSKKYNRLFAIGCSFTNYNNWPTWASVLSQELNIPLYNLGHSGASNKYIQNQLFLLDETYKLTQDDLVITQWTGHNRLSVLGDSFWSESDEWKHYGDVTEKWKGHGRATTDFKKLWYSNIGSDAEYIKDQCWRNIYTLQSLLKDANIDYIFCFTDFDIFRNGNNTYNKDNILYPIDWNNFFQIDELNGFNQWTRKNSYAIGPMGHPLDDANIEYGKQVKDWYETRNNTR